MESAIRQDPKQLVEQYRNDEYIHHCLKQLDNVYDHAEIVGLTQNGDLSLPQYSERTLTAIKHWENELNNYKERVYPELY